MNFALTSLVFAQEQACKIFVKPRTRSISSLGFAKTLYLSLICLFVVLGVDTKSLSAASLPQTDLNEPSGAAVDSTVAETLPDLFDMIKLPADCELIDRGTMPEFWISENSFRGSYSIWKNCDESDSFLGYFLARPDLDDGTFILIKRILDEQDDLIPFQLALSEQFQQRVIWGDLEDGSDPIASSSEGTPDASRPSAGSTDNTIGTPTSTATPTSGTTPTPTATLASTASQATASVPSPPVTTTVSPEPLATDAPSAADASDVSAIVEIESLNMRSGPGISYPRIGVVGRGDVLTVTGKSSNCSWIQFQTPTGIMAWVSAGSQFLRIVGDCSAAPTVQPPPMPTPAPTRDAASSRDENDLSSATDPDKGCYLIENFLGVKLTFTMTRSTDGWSRTFTVPIRQEQLECFEPGPYTYTIDAPPPWNSINGKLDVSPGDELRWAVGGQ